MGIIQAVVATSRSTVWRLCVNGLWLEDIPTWHRADAERRRLKL